MKITLNGKEVQTDSKNLEELLTEHSIQKEKVAVEVDEVVIPKSQFTSFTLKENSKVEIIIFVGGG